MWSPTRTVTRNVVTNPLQWCLQWHYPVTVVSTVALPRYSGVNTATDPLQWGVNTATDPLQWHHSGEYTATVAPQWGIHRYSGEYTDTGTPGRCTRGTTRVRTTPCHPITPGTSPPLPRAPLPCTTTPPCPLRRRTRAKKSKITKKVTNGCFIKRVSVYKRIRGLA